MALGLLGRRPSTLSWELPLQQQRGLRSPRKPVEGSGFALLMGGKRPSEQALPWAGLERQRDWSVARRQGGAGTKLI
jgi:hypothetical protein